MEDSKILETTLEALGINANILSKKLGFKSHSSIYHILHGRNELSSNMIYKIIRAYPNVNKGYLSKSQLPILLDERQMLSQANILNISLAQKPEINTIQRLLDIPDQLDRIEQMLKQLLDNN